MKPFLLASALLSLSVIQAPAQNDGEEARAPIPADLIEDPHVREELGINEFTAPSIRLIFDDLDQLSPLPVEETKHELPKRMPLDRADLAMEIGFLIAEGFLAVQHGDMDAIEPLAKELSRYGRALGAGDRVNRHAASLLENAKKNKIEVLKTELAATQKDVEIELVNLRDADLAHLISLGGWVRALECAAVAVNNDFTEERANQLFREDVADYYHDSLLTLEPRVAKRPEFEAMTRLCLNLQKAMTLPADQEPTEARVQEIKTLASELAIQALKRSE